MSKADKMFKELGYEKVRDTQTSIFYLKNFNDRIDTSHINFYLVSRTIEVSWDYSYSREFDVLENLAIHEKTKELGWLDE